MSGISEAYVAAMEALATVITERPFPKPLAIADVGDWKLTANSSGEDQEVSGTTLAAYSLLVEHKTFFAICVLDPSGGLIGGGMTEGEFIDQMKAVATGRAA